MINYLPCSIKTLDNPDRAKGIAEASNHEEVQESGTELKISEEVESNESDEELLFGCIPRKVWKALVNRAYKGETFEEDNTE